jgi:hypothetical protein
MVGDNGMMCPAGSYRFMYYFGVSILYIFVFLVGPPSLSQEHPPFWSCQQVFVDPLAYTGVTPGGGITTYVYKTHINFLFLF